MVVGGVAEGKGGVVDAGTSACWGVGGRRGRRGRGGAVIALLFRTSPPSLFGGRWDGEDVGLSG